MIQFSAEFFCLLFVMPSFYILSVHIQVLKLLMCTRVLITENVSQRTKVTFNFAVKKNKARRRNVSKLNLVHGNYLFYLLCFPQVFHMFARFPRELSDERPRRDNFQVLRSRDSNDVACLPVCFF